MNNCVYLHTYGHRSGIRHLKAADQRERRMTGHVICIQIIKLVRGPFEHLVIMIKSPIL